MPPFFPRKRLGSTPPPSPRPGSVKRARLADVLDAETSNGPGLKNNKSFSLGSGDSDSSLSEVDSDEFEDVPARANIPPRTDNEEEDDEDIEWEDAATTSTAAATNNNQQHPLAHRPLAKGPIQVTFRKDDGGPVYQTNAASTTGKKGPTKREKEVRIRTHQTHVQFLLWHNAIRNRWICDQAVQQTLVQQLPPPIKKEVEKWRRASGIAEPEPEVKASLHKGQKRAKQRAGNARNERDWGKPSQRLEPGKADLSHGDPLIPLLKVLSAYWKKRFAITAPGLRKRGYGSKQALKQQIASFRNDEHDPEKHGERIRHIEEFRDLARRCEGSRDVGAQLFTALLRGLGIESRLVANLQPSGYGWTKAEQMLPQKGPPPVTEDDYSLDDSETDDSVPISEIAKPVAEVKRSRASRSRRSTGQRSAPIELDSDQEETKDDDVTDITTRSMPKRRTARYDGDIAFPIFWTEAISPITSTVVPVSPLVLPSPVASTPEVLATFEPRGAKAEKSKIVMAYVVAYSSDGTAKDVTTRYLRKRIWPGKTKGFRFPIEKIPVYDKRGKIKRHEEYDWFKHVMSGYVRTDAMRTAVDDVEDSSDLVPQLPDKKESKDDTDTLQSLRTSADFVLERFLRREEALRPGAKPDRMFVSGKGDHLKEEPVYRRSDVERCLTAESWHKEGRRPKAGEVPMKLVPVRAVTLTRKREAEEHERQTGEKQMQGLYSWDQTEYIIPPPISGGIIPKNAYGNIDCFVPSMVPRGAVHIPLRGTVRICKRLEIDYAEAVTGFEFGNKRAVPICEGVVVAQENEKAVIDAWTKYNEEQRKKEESKMEQLVLGLWRKFVMGLRIRERVQDAYGGLTDDNSALVKGTTKDQPIDVDDVETFDADEQDMAGGFLLPHEDDLPEQEDLVMEQHEPEPIRFGKGKGIVEAQYPTPTSLSPEKPSTSTRPSLLLETDGDTDLSDLSSVPDDVKSVTSDDQSRTSTLASPPPQNSRAKPKEATISRPTRHREPRSSTRPSSALDDPDSDNGSHLSELPSSMDNDTDEEEFVSNKRRQNKGSNSQMGKQRSRPDSSHSGKEAPIKAQRGKKDASTPTSSRTRRSMRTNSTLITSPYFDG